MGVEYEKRLNELKVYSAAEENSFARETMSSRIPSIAKNVLEHHQHRFTSDQVEQLTELYHAMVNDQAIQRISDAQDDSQMWLSELDKYKGYTWLKMPWFLSESYFFRLLLEFSGYFSTGFDPFSHK